MRTRIGDSLDIFFCAISAQRLRRDRLHRFCGQRRVGVVGVAAGKRKRSGKRRRRQQCADQRTTVQTQTPRRMRVPTPLLTRSLAIRRCGRKALISRHKVEHPHGVQRVNPKAECRNWVRFSPPAPNGTGPTRQAHRATGLCPYCGGPVSPGCGRWQGTFPGAARRRVSGVSARNSPSAVAMASAVAAITAADRDARRRPARARSRRSRRTAAGPGR